MPPSVPRLSIAMIVRDEEQHIGPCLDSVHPLRAQVVIVDTGSIDHTPTIAREFGAEVHQLPWPGDFSTARNESLRHCTGEWILVLDADERLNPEDHATIELHLSGVPCGYRMTTRNYSNAVQVADFVRVDPSDPIAHGFAGWYPSTKVRLFPRRDTIRFAGAVHELVNESLLASALSVMDSPVVIHHYGFERDDESIRRKRRFYLELGERKTRDNPSNAKAWEELAEQYLELGRPLEAMKAYRAAVELQPNEARLLAGLGAALALADEAAAAARALDLALQIDANLGGALRNRGVLHIKSREYQQAEVILRRARMVGPSDAEARRYLAIALNELGEPREALDIIHESLRIYPHCPEARALESALVQKLG